MIAMAALPAAVERAKILGSAKHTFCGTDVLVRLVRSIDGKNLRDERQRRRLGKANILGCDGERSHEFL